MKFVFFGTPEFAAIILEKLINFGFIPEAVICNPDRPIGRKKIITPPPVKKLLIEKLKNYKIKILQPENLVDIKNQLSAVNCQLFVVAAYAKIIPKEILEIPRLGSIGVHPSLLPKYRGPSPIQSVILNDEKETGVTLFLMDEKVDHGKIVSSIKYQASSDDNYESLIRKLAELSANLLIEALSNIEEKIKNAKSQNESFATYTKKFTTKDAFIEPANLEKAQGSICSPQEIRRLAIEIDRKIRALNPEPGTWTLRQAQGKLMRIKLLEVEITQNGKLKLKKIQTEGKKPKIL
ncbi:MAG: methionyl-tRNA formyltransferase [Patescibacteria group bacterium]